jgi:alpha-tubulin suppressor-like RCC1 family protein
VNKAAPTPLAAIADAREVALGEIHTLILRADGTVSASGYNFYGQLGIGTSGTGTNSPAPVTVLTSGTPITALSGIVKVCAGTYFSLALDSAGRVWAWGAGSQGQLGVNDLNDRSYATRVRDPGDATGFLTGIVDIAAGDSTAYALRANGTVIGWGSGAFNSFGSGQGTLNRTVPGPIGGLPPAAAIYASAYSAFAATAWASYDSFVAENFTPQEIAAGQSAPTFDFTGTGRANLLAYLLDTDPRQPARLPATYLWREAGQLVFETDYLATAADLSLSFESSTDLVTWTPATPQSATYLDLGDKERATLRFNAGPAPDKLFLRLKGTLLNP